MLFGATLEPVNTGSPAIRLVTTRSSSQWRPLYWMLTILHHHGVDMAMNNGAATIRSKLTFASRSSPFFGAPLARWTKTDESGTRTIATPLIKLTPEIVTPWLVDSMSRAEPEKRPDILLRAPGMSRTVAIGMAKQVSQLRRDWHAKAFRHSKSWTVRIPPDAAQAVESWLLQRVPPAVWRGPSAPIQ